MGAEADFSEGLRDPRSCRTAVSPKDHRDLQHTSSRKSASVELKVHRLLSSAGRAKLLAFEGFSVGFGHHASKDGYRHGAHSVFKIHPHIVRVTELPQAGTGRRRGRSGAGPDP